MSATFRLVLTVTRSTRLAILPSLFNTIPCRLAHHPILCLAAPGAFPEQQCPDRGFCYRGTLQGATGDYTAPLPLRFTNRRLRLTRFRPSSCGKKPRPGLGVNPLGPFSWGCHFACDEPRQSPALRRPSLKLISSRIRTGNMATLGGIKSISLPFFFFFCRKGTSLVILPLLIPLVFALFSVLVLEKCLDTRHHFRNFSRDSRSLSQLNPHRSSHFSPPQHKGRSNSTSV